MDLKGTVIKVFPKKQISDKFALREFVIRTADKYPQEVILQVSQERCSLLDNIAEGEEVQAFINVRGRSWTNPKGEIKYFNTLEAWKVSNESAQSFESYQDHSSKYNKGGVEANFMEDAISTVQSQDDDGLPF